MKLNNFNISKLNSKELIYIGVILLLSTWILFYGSVYETEYYSWIYILADEYLVIALLYMIAITIMYYDYTLGLLSIMIVFFITNDIPILRKQITVISRKKKKEGFKTNNDLELKGTDASAKKLKDFINAMNDSMDMLKKTSAIKRLQNEIKL
jgi:hypothetical protein